MRMSPTLQVTEDTPADMLAGSMDLDIILPSGQIVRNSVIRSTPMMDLLVQVTTAHRLSPGSHSLQAMGERGVLPYKPSTPIGALDTFTVRIVQKKTNLLKKAPQVPTMLPTTFRLSVHLPRSQLFVMRVTPAVTIGDIMQKVSEEKNLDVAKYELRKTGNMDQPLKSGQSIGEVETQELTLVVKGSDHVRQLSSADIMQVKQANNIRLNNGACDSSLSSGSLDSRSISPVAVAVPQPPQRKKRRPAPKPPEITQMRISHSRESSDSSGYHEPSTLSESPTHGRPPSDITPSTRQHSLAGMTPRNSHSLSNLTSLPSGRLPSSPSVTSLSSNGGKKKRAPPPPSIQAAPTITADKPKAATLPADSRPPAPVDALPPAPVELAPSPPTSPDSPLLHSSPRLSKKPSIRERTIISTLSEPQIETNLSSNDTLNNLPSEVSKDYEKIAEIHCDVQQVSENIQSLGKSPKKVFSSSKKKFPTIYPDVQKSEVDKECQIKEDEEKEIDSSNSNVEFTTTNFRESKSSPVLARHMNDTLPKTRGGEQLDFMGISRWGEVSNLNLTDESCSFPEFRLGSASNKKDFFVDSEDEEFQTGDTFEQCRTDDLQEPSTLSSEGPTSDGDSQPDSLTVEWEYQLPPPPSHFRDLPVPAHTSPTPTDVATLGTVDTLNTLIVDKNIALRKLNGIYEDCEPEVKVEKNNLDEPDRIVRRIDEKKVVCEEVIQKKENLVRENGYVSDQKRTDMGPKELQDSGLTEKVLVNKSEVMNELTNILLRNRPEKSQSYSNLYIPSGLLDGKRKSNTLSHSQSFLNPPIANFKITNYDQRPKPEQEEFKKPAVPRQNGVRRSDSMNVKKVTVDSMEKLQQQFLQFLQEKELLDSGVELEDLNVVPVVHKKVKDEPVQDKKSVVVNRNDEPAIDEKVLPKLVTDVKHKELPFEDAHVDVERKIIAPMRDEKMAADISTEAVKVDGTVEKVQSELATPFSKEDPKSQVISTKEPESLAPKIVAMEPKKEPARRSFYQPPAISMGTWGDRPKSKVLIKDDDYVTEAELTKKWATLEKSASMSVVSSKVEAPWLESKAETTKPTTPDKKTVISFKKPKNYELFSALNRRKELEIEDDASRLPKVCAVELKKEFRPEPDRLQDLEVEKNVIKVEDVSKPVPKTTSVYLNGAPKPWNVDNHTATKFRTNLMPVVKGFRSVPHDTKTTDSIVRQESLPTFTNKSTESMQRQQSLPAKVSEPVKGIPAPPPMGFTLKPVAARVIKPKVCDDPRGLLLEQIRSFGGSDRLRKTVQ